MYGDKMMYPEEYLIPIGVPISRDQARVTIVSFGKIMKVAGCCCRA